jgi:hypothetical protein
MDCGAECSPEESRHRPTATASAIRDSMQEVNSRAALLLYLPVQTLSSVCAALEQRASHRAPFACGGLVGLPQRPSNKYSHRLQRSSAQRGRRQSTLQR